MASGRRDVDKLPLASRTDAATTRIAELRVVILRDGEAFPVS